MRPAKPVCGGRRNGQDWWRRPLDEGTADAATSRAAGRNAQGLLRAGERRRPPGLDVRGPYCDGWPVYHAVHDARVGHDLRRRRQRVARRRRLAQRRPRRDVGALERGPRLRRGRRAEALEGLGPDRPAHGRVLAGAEAAGVFESRDGGATWSLLSTLDGQPGRDAWNIPDEPAARPPRACRRSCPHPDERRPLLGRDPGLRHLRDDRRRRPRGRRATAACAPTGRSRTPRSATACTSS